MDGSGIKKLIKFAYLYFHCCYFLFRVHYYQMFYVKLNTYYSNGLNMFDLKKWLRTVIVNVKMN